MAAPRTVHPARRRRPAAGTPAGTPRLPPPVLTPRAGGQTPGVRPRLLRTPPPAVPLVNRGTQPPAPLSVRFTAAARHGLGPVLLGWNAAETTGGGGLTRHIPVVAPSTPGLAAPSVWPASSLLPVPPPRQVPRPPARGVRVAPTPPPPAPRPQVLRAPPAAVFTPPTRPVPAALMPRTAAAPLRGARPQVLRAPPRARPHARRPLVPVLPAWRTPPTQTPRPTIIRLRAAAGGTPEFYGGPPITLVALDVTFAASDPGLTANLTDPGNSWTVVAQ